MASASTFSKEEEEEEEKLEELLLREEENSDSGAAARAAAKSRTAAKAALVAAEAAAAAHAAARSRASGTFMIRTMSADQERASSSLQLSISSTSCEGDDGGEGEPALPPSTETAPGAATASSAPPLLRCFLSLASPLSLRIPANHASTHPAA